jgi:O-antigen/teichoic acid export membrane protein
MLAGSSLALGLRAGGVLASFGFLLLVARVLGASGTGQYHLAYAMVIVASVIGLLGLNHAALKLVASATARADWDEARAVAKASAAIALGAGGAVGALVWTVGPVIGTSVFESAVVGEAARIMAWSIPPWALAQALGGALLGAGRVAGAQLVQQVVPALGSLVLFGGMTWAGMASVQSASAAYVAACVISALVANGLWWRATRRQARGRARSWYPHLRPLVRVGGPLMGVAAVSLGNGWIAATFLGIYASAAAVGLYNAAFRLVMPAYHVVASVGAIAAPRMAACYDAGDPEGVDVAKRQAGRVMAGLAIPGLLVLAAWPSLILSVFGEEFRAAAPALSILALAHLAHVVAGPSAQVLAMTGKERALRSTAVVGSLLHAAGCWALAESYEATGAAVGMAVGTTVTALLVIAVARRARSAGDPTPGEASLSHPPYRP